MVFSSQGSKYNDIYPLQGIDLNISKLIVNAALHFAYLSRINKQEDND